MEYQQINLIIKNYYPDRKRIPNSKANFKEANISLDIFTLGLKIKINKPEILVDKQNINLKSFTIFSDLKSSFEEKYFITKNRN